MRKALPQGLEITFEGGLTEEVTPHAGSALLIELGRRSGVMAAAEKYLPAKRSRRRRVGTRAVCGVLRAAQCFGGRLHR